MQETDHCATVHADVNIESNHLHCALTWGARNKGCMFSEQRILRYLICYRLSEMPGLETKSWQIDFTA